mmetsp:Transcript_47349/g.71685  ORF Transcript_47349/g.71685 Transcript_47349/m.71685 type:complete len:124 (-) Transcript_47349:287-658(-)
MARTFIFIYSYALPFALADSMIQPVGAMLVIFFITYGFLGLEFVAMELDDPFGDDPNDFDNLGMARVAIEDIYYNINKNDGAKSVEILRKQVARNLEEEGALNSVRNNLTDDFKDCIADIYDI